MLLNKKIITNLGLVILLGIFIYLFKDYFFTTVHCCSNQSVSLDQFNSTELQILQNSVATHNIKYDIEDITSFIKNLNLKNSEFLFGEVDGKFLHFCRVNSNISTIDPKVVDIYIKDLTGLEEIKAISSYRSS
jgi:hypothetical protein